MIRVFKFKKNDLNPSAGKQIEYSVSDVRDFFKFPNDEVTIYFRYHSAKEGDYLNGLKFSSTFKLSPARGDYKCYGNSDGSLNLKSFFLDKLHLTAESNLEDFYALKKVSDSEYIISYFPKTTEFSDIAAFFFSQNTDVNDDEKTEEHSETLDQPLQLIYYGAPGTGKSFTIDKETNENNSVRTTFHPDSDYASFVGAYKPTMENVPMSAFVGKEVHFAQPQGEHTGTERKIVYKYVPQAFLKAYVEAWSRYAAGEDNPYYLVIEEINRGNCAQIFGDLFQLLDRNNMGCSSYAISADEDIAQFLREDEKGFGKLTEEQRNAISGFVLKKDSGVEEHIGLEILNGSKLLLPPNLRIWATMNTSDQSLFPIDSAFKRRWNWEYMPIEYDPADKSAGERLAWKLEVRGKMYYWGDFLAYINPKILKLTMSEDKQMGYFFAKPDKRGSDGRLDIISEKVFVNKVLFYLWTDVFKDYDLTEDPFVYESEGSRTRTAYRFTDFFPVENNDMLVKFVGGLGLTEMFDDSVDKDIVEETPTDSTTQEKNRALWAVFFEYVKTDDAFKSAFNVNRTPSKDSWMDFTIGLPNVWLNVQLLRTKSKVRISMVVRLKAPVNSIYETKKGDLESKLSEATGLKVDSKTTSLNNIMSFEFDNEDFDILSNPNPLFKSIADNLVTAQSVAKEILSNL